MITILLDLVCGLLIDRSWYINIHVCVCVRPIKLDPVINSSFEYLLRKNSRALFCCTVKTARIGITNAPKILPILAVSDSRNYRENWPTLPIFAVFIANFGQVFRFSRFYDIRQALPILAILKTLWNSEDAADFRGFYREIRQGCPIFKVIVKFGCAADFGSF